MTQKEKEKKVYDDYQSLIADGKLKLEAINIVMKKYHYGYPASVYNVLRRVESRNND